MRKYTAIPCEVSLNCPFLVIYYDADMEDADGHGWCVEAHPGSTTQRYETYVQLMEYMTYSLFYKSFIEVQLT